MERVSGVRSAELLATGGHVVYEVADKVGFSDTKYFSREFKKQFGVLPREYKAH
jgi:AraC-like DNA-binding protein